MIRLEIVGNLGADAEIKDYNGNKFVSFRVAHSEKWVDRQTGSIMLIKWRWQRINRISEKGN